MTCDFPPTPLPVQPGCPAQQSDNRGQQEHQIAHHNPLADTLSVSATKLSRSILLPAKHAGQGVTPLPGPAAWTVHARVSHVTRELPAVWHVTGTERECPGRNRG